MRNISFFHGTQVEKAPVVIKANVPKADAENMKKQIEAAGAKVELV
jgi:ribosomal protein L7/L12